MSHPYLDEIWGKVPESQKAFYENLRATWTDDFEKLLHTAVLTPDGEVVPADMVTVMLWKTQNPEAYRIAKIEIGGKVEAGGAEVSTVFCYVDLAGTLGAGEHVHFETKISGAGCDTDERIQSTHIVAALRVHESCVRKVRSKLNK